MAFTAVCRSLYDYSPQGEGELELKENDLLLVLDNSSDDGWWKAKKKAASDSEDEPEGLIPNNYVECAVSTHKVRALYDYTRQTDEELTFLEDAILDVYDVSDPDWTLCGLDSEFGFVPSNYVETLQPSGTTTSPPSAPTPGNVSAVGREPTPPPMPTRPLIPNSPVSEVELPSSSRIPSSNSHPVGRSATLAVRTDPDSSPPSSARSRGVRFASTSQQIETPVLSSPPQDRAHDRSNPTSSTTSSPPEKRKSFFNMWSTSPIDVTDKSVQVPEAVESNYTSQGFKLYTIYQYKKATGKDIKVPFLLGVNVAQGLVLTSDLSHHNAKEQIWEGSKMSNYSAEGKVLFLDLVKPSESYHLHCGNTETAREIMARLGEIAGASRLGGMEDVIAAAQAPRKVTMGRVRNDPSPTQMGGIQLRGGEIVTVLDADPAEEWWRVQKVIGDDSGLAHKGLIELLSPSEIKVVERQIKDGTFQLGRSSTNGASSARHSSRHAKADNTASSSNSLPQRASSLQGGDSLAPKRNGSLNHSSTRDSRQPSSSHHKREREKPDPAKVRVWTDRSGTFKVEAQFLGIRDGKIHLHKTNGVQIAVPVPKMSLEDIEYVERKAAISLDEDKPLSEIRRKASTLDPSRNRAGISIQSDIKQYDWFGFFLACGVNPHICERYSNAFKQDQMREDQMADINEKLLKNLGVKEGDVLRIMKYLDAKFGRLPAGESSGGGLFSGPGGTLHNNTKKSRPPAPDGPDSSKVDPEVLKQKTEDSKKGDNDPKPAAGPGAPSGGVDILGFDDDAWAPRPVQSTATGAASGSGSGADNAAEPGATGALADLAALTPLKAVKLDKSNQASAPQSQPHAQPQPSMQTGATPDLFQQVAQLSIQPVGQGRQRPAAPPPQTANSGSVIAPIPTTQGLGPAHNLPPQITGAIPPGSSLIEINQQRLAATANAANMPVQGQMLHPQMMAMQPQMTGFPQMGAQGMMMPAMTGMMTGAPQQMTMGMPQMGVMGNTIAFPSHQFMGNQTGSPFADPTPFQAQQTGFQPQPTGFQPQLTGFQPHQMVFTPQSAPAMQPQAMGFHPQQTGFQSSQMPPQSLPPSMILHPQATGLAQFGPSGVVSHATGTLPLSALQPMKAEKPVPNVKFGIGSSKTGRQKANLAQATPDNPFGF